MESICKPSLLWQMVFPRFQFSIMRKTNVQDDMVYHSCLSCYVHWMANKVMWCYNCLFSCCNCLQLEGRPAGLCHSSMLQQNMHPPYSSTVCLNGNPTVGTLCSQSTLCLCHQSTIVCQCAVTPLLSLLIVQPLAQHTRVSTGSKMTLYLENFFVTLEWIGLLQFFFGGSALLSNLITCPR